MLNRLSEKAQINLNGKSLSFHCFRKMFLSTSIDSGIGLTAGKKLCGKAIAQSDDTYLTTVNLRQKFIQLKKFLSITEQPRLEIEKIEPLKNAINKLQSDLTEQKTITNVISEENQKIKKDIEKIKNAINSQPDIGREVTDHKAEVKRINEWLIAHPEEAKQEDKMQKERDEDLKFYKKIMKEDPGAIVAHIEALELKLHAIKDALQKTTNKTKNT